MLSDAVVNLSRKLLYLEPDQTTVVSGARLIDGTGAPPREGMSIVLEGDRIKSIGPAGAATPVGEGVRKIDGAGMTVIPGLIDCHVHFTGETAKGAIERYSPNVWPAYRGIVTVWDAARVLEAGFTTVRSLGHGIAEHVYGLRRATAEGLIPGPRILTCGWALSQTGGHGDPHFLPQEITVKYRPRSTFADGPYECRRMVRQNFGEGADLAKIYTTEGSLVGDRAVKSHMPNFTLEEIQAMADEAHGRGAKLAAHVMTPSDVRRSVLGGVDTIEHGGHLGNTPDILELMVERGTFLVPTMTILEALINEAAEIGVKPFGVAWARGLLEHQKGYLRRALDMGVKIALGTDTGIAKRGVNARELTLLVSAGFTPMEALVAGTRTASEALGLDEHLGTLEVGKVGEMVMVAGDPLATIGSLEVKDNIRWILKSRDQLR